MTFVQYITPSRVGGAETYFLELCAFLAKRGHRVIVVTKRDSTLRAEADKLLNPLGVQVLGWHTCGKFDPRTLLRLVRLIRRERAALINTHLTTASWVGAWAARLAGVPSIAWIHGRDKKTWFQFAGRLIAVANSVREYLVEQGVPEQKIDLLYYGVDVRRFVPPTDQEKRDAKQSFDLAPDARTISVVASLIERKGHRFLLDAVANLPADLQLLFAGEGVLEEPLRAQVKTLGLENRVHFLGFQRDVERVLAATDILCLPSLKEGLPISIMEAQARAVTVVAARTAGIPEVVREGETGFICEPGDVKSLRLALKRALENPDISKQIGMRARNFIEANFDREACLTRVETYLLEQGTAKPQ
ncbi:N-acetyl-alpha-D-glucosaminyl L-malate synthase [Abditibacteriota bacterium]|nr:N-acetyl-alpha-D-glucosaminyl L-malate synthase [Abditibacteriota bacterium]